MADDDSKTTRSIAEEIGEEIVNSVQTPTELFFMALFVLGVLSLAATTLVGDCGRVDDDLQYPDPRTIDIRPGAVVFTTSSVIFGEFIAEPGVCGIVESVDEERRIAKVHILAKAEPGFLEQESYQPLDALDKVFTKPLSTLFFLHDTPPTGEVPIYQLAVMPTQHYTNWFRHLFLSRIYIVMAVLALLVGALGYIGYRFETKRVLWYERHTLRSKYRAKLMQDRERVRTLLATWDEITLQKEGEDPAQWKDALLHLDAVLEGVLTQLHFEGHTLTERLQGMKKEDLWCIERLWEAHSLIVRMQGQVEANEQIPPITKKAVEEVYARYKEAHIWLGLLEHHA